MHHHPAIAAPRASTFDACASEATGPMDALDLNASGQPISGRAEAGEAPWAFTPAPEAAWGDVRAGCDWSAPAPSATRSRASPPASPARRERPARPARPEATPADDPALMSWSTTLGRWLALAPAAPPAGQPRKQRWSYRPALPWSAGPALVVDGQPDDVHGCGWFDSSQDLREGLLVAEHEADSPVIAALPVEEWVQWHLSQSALRVPQAPMPAADPWHGRVA